MKRIHRTNRLTLIKLFASVAIVAGILVTIFAGSVPQSRHRAPAIRIYSVNSLKQVTFALHIGAGTNGGAMP